DPKALPCADDIDSVTRNAGTDFSVAAERRLEAELGKGCAAAALVRAPNGTFVVVVARGTARMTVAAASTDPAATFERVERPTFDACTSAPVASGACMA